MSEFYKQEFCEANQKYSVIIEDDDRVAYAYLLCEREIIGDVWLYNKISTPATANWKDFNEIPFLNPKEFEYEKIAPILINDKLDIEWELTPEMDLLRAKIYIRLKLIAILAPNFKPGWSCIVTKDGPLALKYE